MSQGEDLYAAREDTARPAFELALRGYDKRQVDQYVARTDSEIAGLEAERERSQGRLRDLAGQIQQMQAELTDLRQRPAQIDQASFRDLGPMVDQILALAEKQADAIVTSAAQRAAQHQSDAEKALAEAREHADEMRAEGQRAREQAEQEAKQLAEQSAQQAEQSRTETEAAAEAARTQLQQEIEAARTQAQQELAQWKAGVDRDITEQRNAATQKNAALHAEAQQYSADIRRRTDEQAAAHQQQLAVVQQEIRARQQAVAQLQGELETAQQRLTQLRQEGAAAETEVNQLQQRLGEVTQDLSAELARLDDARRSADSAERHAKEVRARVQREAKRVADLAAAAVMAAAAGGAETGEYPKVVRPGGNPVAAAPAVPVPAGPVLEVPEAAEPDDDDTDLPVVPLGRELPALTVATPARGNTLVVPVQREPQAEHAAADAE